MTNEESLLLRAFEAKAQRMIAALAAARNEAATLRSQLAEREQQIDALRQELATCRTHYADLRSARLIASTGDIEDTRKRIQALIRQVNKCITILSNGDIANDGVKSEE